MTQQEFIAAAQQVVNEFWEKYRPANLLNTENNASALVEGIWDFLQKTGCMPSARDIRAIVKFLGDIESGGKLQFHNAPKVIVQQAAPPPPPNPIDNLPHANIKELNFLKTVEDVQKYQARVQKDGLDYMSGFKYLKAGSKPYEHINARIAFILKNEIHASAPPKETTPKPIITVHSDITEAHKAVENMTLADVGSSGSSAGRRTLLARKQERLHADIDQMLRSGKSPSVVLQRTKDDIKKFGESSIR